MSTGEDGVTIRRMRHEDVAAATAILAEWNMAPRSDLEDAERSGIDIENAFVAELDGRILGMASFLVLDDATAETASLAVDPASRGLGIGYRLQVARMEEMLRRGFRRLRTETDRPATIDWYIEKFGYRRIGSNPKKHDFSLPDVDEWTVLELDLQEWARRRAPPPAVS
jgi:3-keto-5-aminohexanoate cleavage enzyme